MFVTEKLRSRKSRSGSIGIGVVQLVDDEGAEQATPAEEGAESAGLPQPSCGCSMKPPTRRPSPAVHRIAPGTSTRRSSAAPGASAEPHRRSERDERDRHVDQEDDPPARDVDQPAAEGRADDERDAGPGRPLPIALPRAAPVKVAVIIASDAGVSSAPAIPCRPRKTMSVGASGASAQSTEAPAKLAMPSAKIGAPRRCRRASRRRG